MRISRVRSDSGYRPGRNLPVYRVLLDGAPVDEWVTADEERGMVERHVPVGDPGWTSGATEIVHGLVKIIHPSFDDPRKADGFLVDGEIQCRWSSPALYNWFMENV